MFDNKRGISPLFATILLIAFSVALGAVVMSWGESYIEEKAEFAKGVQEVSRGCSDVYFTIMQVSATPQICQRGDTIEAFIENGPNADILNIQAKVIGTDNVAVIDNILKKSMPRAGSAKSNFAFAPVGKLRQVKLTPIIRRGTDVIYCPQRAVQLEGISQC
jgi:flagellin-like protein